MQIDPKKLSKKAYRRPELVTYGDIQVITQATAPTGALDGAATGHMRS